MENRDLHMITEISKIITNTLTTEGGIHLPKIGSLAKGKDGKKIKLRQSDDYTSLITILSKMGSMDEEQATALYERWLELVSVSEGYYQIDTIGTIKDGVLTVEHKLYSRINATKEGNESNKSDAATPEKPKAESPKSGDRNGLKYLLIVVVLGAMAATGWFLLPLERSKVVNESVVEVVEEPKSEVVVKEEPTAVATEDQFASLPTPGRVYVAPGEALELKTSRGRTAESEKALNALEVALKRSGELQNKRYLVVLCSYSRPANAGRLIIDFEYYYRHTPIDIFAVQQGNSTMVVLYGANSEKECMEYIDNYGKKIASTLWVSEI